MAATIRPWRRQADLKALVFPFIWSSEEKKTVYRRAGNTLAPLNEVLYPELYEKAGFEDGDDDTEVPGDDEPDPDPVPDPENP
ncbi:MAG: hypothetical protein M0R77_00265 [Gammaproteobacteria bacterium]|nr:hypothetical protein [Acholeplasmataceae bacterium]MCK9528988.1 hypothetical protein [Gammaproteobacteria bacterium]